jgi:hypothetical protein
MFKTLLVGLAATAAVVSTGSVATAQTASPAPQTSYTFVAQWQIPRAQWATWATDFDKNTKPVLEKLAAAGTLVGWGAYETIVHSEDGFTHGVWWSATSYAGIETARGELVKASMASASLAGATKHGDLYLRTIAGGGKPSSGTNAYLSVAQFLVKPGSAQDWKAAWDKYEKPTLDEAVAKGILLGYSIDVEDVHTQNPGWRWVVTVAPSAEADDQVSAAFDAAEAKMTPEERKTMGLQRQALLEPGTHRDLYAKIVRHWSK